MSALTDREEHKRRLNEALDLGDPGLEDALLGRLLVKQGLVLESQVEACLRLQAEQAKAGQKPPRLGELLVQKGYLTAEEAGVALLPQSRELLICPSCGGRYSAVGTEAKNQYPCKKCGKALERLELLLGPGETTGAVRIDVPDDVAAVAKDPGRKLADGKYILVAEVGRGGMGVVWKAWQSDLRRYVAVKILVGTQWDERELKRFYREAQTAAGLSHTNIASIYEVGSDGGRHFIAMEFVDGESLAELLEPPARPGTTRATRYLSPRRATGIVRDASLAVDYAHSRKIIHRDLKPHNIMVQKDGRVYVMDFGLARPIRAASVTFTDTIVGTPSYMSPEQVRGDALDRRSDVYALGAVLYHVLTGRPPFEERSTPETLMAVLADDPVPPRKINPRTHADLETVCLKALDKDRHRRYDSARSFAEDLGHYLDGEPISARPLSAREMFWKSMRRHPIRAVLAAACVAAVLLFALAHGIGRLQTSYRIDELFVQAELAFAEEQDYDKAKGCCDRILELDPDNKEALRFKALCDRTAQGQKDDQRMKIELFRNDAELLMGEGRYEEAIRLYERVLAFDEDDERARADIRLCEAELRKEREAAWLKVEERLLEQRKAERDRQRNRILATADYESARVLFDTARSMRPENGYTIRQSIEKCDEARQALTRAVRADDTYAEAWYFRGQIRHRMGDYKLAAQDFAEALRLARVENPESPEEARVSRNIPAAFASAMTQLTLYMLYSYGPYIRDEEARKAALEKMKEPLEMASLSDDMMQRYCASALEHVRQGRYSQAFDWLMSVAEQGDPHYSYHLLLGCVFLLDHAETNAQQEFDAALELEPASPEANFLMAVVLSNLADVSGAYRRIEAALEAAPQVYVFFLLRARLRESRNDPVELIRRDLEEAATLAGSQADAIRELLRTKYPTSD